MSIEHSATPDNPSGRIAPFRRLGGAFASLRRGRGILAIGVAVAAITVLGAASFLYFEREGTVQSWRSALETESRALAAHAEQSLTAADLVLRSVTDRAQSENIAGSADLRERLGTPAVHDMLRDRQRGVPQISVVSIVDHRGDMVNFTRNFPPRSNSGETINLAERDYFKAHLAAPGLELYISKPVQNNGTGTWTFYLSRKIRAKSGEMIGLVLAGIESAYFEQFYQAIAVPGKSLTLFLADGTNLARYPEGENSLGRNFASSPVFSVLGSGARSAVIAPGTGAVLASLDNEFRVIAPARVPSFPLVVNARASQALVFGSWEWKVWATLGGALALSSVILLLTFALRRVLRENHLAIDSLLAARAQADAASRAKSEFLATMSHEIRIPMNAVIGLSSVLAGSLENPENKPLVGVLESSARHLMTVVNDILDFSRLDSGRTDLAQTDLDLHALADNVIEITREFPGASKLEIRSSIGADVPRYLRTDSARLTQILLNLLNNAVKYTNSGRVDLDIARVETGAQRPMLRFAVTDTGPGVPDLMRERIFEPFEQIATHRETLNKGTGLGLAIARRIAHAMGGDIALDTDYRSGARFVATLPATPGEAPALQESVPVAPIRALHVLVAEDTPANQLVIELILRQLGHTLRLVDSGRKAVDAFEAEEFDAVFLDIQMPVMGGYEAARLIRSSARRGASVPIVALTAFAQPSDREEALRSGMSAHLPKPIRRADVARALEALHLDAPPGRAQAPSAPVVDDNLAELIDLFGEDGLAEALGVFVSDANATLDGLRLAHQAGDTDRTRRLAHKLKGLFAQFGATDAARSAAAVEDGIDGNPAVERLLLAGADAVRTLGPLAARSAA